MDGWGQTASTLTSDAQSGASTQSREGTEAGAAATTATAAEATTATTSNGTPLESQATGAGLPDSSQKAATGMGISNETTVAIASGVVGGIVAISLIAFLIWFWRKRAKKNRRSSLLTPLTVDLPYGSKERDDQYIISRTSLGPTPLPQKLRAMVSYNYQRLRGRVNGFVDRSPSPSVNLNRGNSQFGPLDTPESRSASRNETPNDAPPTTKDRFVDWWGRLTEDANMNWRLKSEPKSNRNDNDPFAVTRSMKEGKSTRIGSQPDFLTLLSQDRATQEGGPSGANNDPSRRRSVSVGNEHFLGGLGLSFDDIDPFSDSNAIPRNSARVAPLVTSGANNPFSDANAIAGPTAAAARMSNGPTTYVQNIRHSRGHSVSAAGGAGSRGPPRVSVTSNRSSGAIYYRESGASVESFETRRNKFRSDPFDLDRPELLRVGAAGTAAVIVSRNASGASKRSRRGSRGFVEDPSMSGPGPQTPGRTHVRAESYSSRYSSGVSSIGDDWSDPGPDVGPGSSGSRAWNRASASTSGGNNNITRTRSGGSQGSVGKAL
ncbi:hypothetical protein F4810DRAFT_473824 [Camillea tinctor]|nr:hypothetical protein F4810DRAFT_473824 [Camillea tinctor]